MCFSHDNFSPAVHTLHSHDFRTENSVLLGEGYTREKKSLSVVDGANNEE